ncbi:hypothetical protein EZ054_04850 [Enterococcus faecalis]|uniref:hypothetical protein n=1 Tax=Enterococcus faecalis TaxID=1351 RepID=UPI0011443432|nr:hypothetical protein [Enterococcus faecalis]EIA6622775.1 hypothetical protein [Enterococcus faecalis]EIA6788668.1 hypothetical protein [Enterococcus faecalis]MBP4075302.1 hypothetical protein [Enterococcus faecalis]MBP4093410.1 hypothetical protein [Enterococcus faecalis]MUN82244.1 hypothetical protein [Enterococcus faecalis]
MAEKLSTKAVYSQTRDQFEMDLSVGQGPEYPGRFGTLTDTISDVEYVRDNLAVKYEWKPSIDKVVTYQVKKGENLAVLEGPVGAQIDLGADKYLSGGAHQKQILVDRGSNLMDYLEIVNVRPIK